MPRTARLIEEAEEAMARHFDIKSLALPTNGNAGAALAAYAARVGMEAVVVCPASLLGKLLRINPRTGRPATGTS